MITSVFTDQTEYCRYHDQINVITATIIVSSPSAGTPIAVSLNRLDGYGVVCTKTVSEATNQTQYQVTFDLNKDTYDTENIYRAKAGDYTIQASENGGTAVSSAMFAISIVSVKELKETWCKGVTFYSYEVLEPRIQPQAVTGATITEVSANHYKGAFQLAFVAVNGNQPATLSWNGGPAVSINGTTPLDILLMNSSSNDADFIMVHVNPTQIPVANCTESIYIDNGRITDRAIIDQVRRATSVIQQAIITKVEPEIIDTDPSGAYCDEIGIPETYYRPKTFNKWMSFKLPYPNLLDVSVNAYFNQTETAQVPRGWTVWNERTGIVELVPSTSVQVIWNFYNGIFMLMYLFNYDSIPGMWHYRVTAGLRDLWNERGIVRQAIALSAATQLLVSAGSAYRAGYASMSSSRDGLSESEGFTSSASFGTFGGHYINYQKWLEENLPKMKKRFCGMQFVTI